MLLLAAVTAFIRRKKSRARDTRASRTMDEIFAPTSGNKDYNYGNEETASAWESPRPTERAVDASMPTEYANNAPGGMGYDAGHQQNMNYYDNGHGQAYNDNYRGAAPQTYLPQLSDQTFAGVTSPVMNYSGLANTSPETAAATAAGIPMKHLDPHRQQEDAYYQENYDHQDPYQGYHNAPSGVPGAVAAQGATVYDNHGMTHQGYADPSMPQHQGHYDEYAYNAGYGHDGYYQEQPYDRHHYGNVEQDMYADQAGYSHGFQNSHQEPSSAANMNYSGASGLPSDGHRAPPTPMDQQHAYTEASAGPYDEQMANHQYYTSQSGYPQSSAKPNATEGQPASENRLNAH
ncbi:hypothetical protein BDF14DRAFT_1751345 [Spinellus fusiger]|nr:hypothetical protein BDF14DRAFT_1751345 [Spinellus fusiger]